MMLLNWLLITVFCLLLLAACGANLGGNPDMDDQQVYVVTITAYDPAIAAERTLYGTTGLGMTTKPTDTPPNTRFIPRVKQAGSLRRDCFGNGTTGGASRSSYGEIIFSNVDGALDGWLTYGYGRPFTIEVGPQGADYPAGFSLVYTGIVEQPVPTLQEMRFTVRDSQMLLEQPIQTLHYAGDNSLPAGVEGVADDIKGRVKPLVMGWVKNFKPVCVNTSKLIYQYNAGDYLPSAFYVYDKGVQIFTAGQTPYADQADLESRAPSAGTYIKWSEGGMIRLGSSPAGQVTMRALDTTTIADLIIAAATQGGYAGALGFDDALNDPFGGIYIDNERTVGSVLDELCNSAGAWWGFDRSNVFQARQLVDPAGVTAVAELNVGNILSIERNATRDTDRGVPIWQVTLGLAPNYAVMKGGDLADSLTEDIRTFLGTDYIYATASDSSIQTAFPHAATLSKNTLITSGGAAEAARLLALYGTLRSRYDLRVKLTPDLAQQLDLGKVVTLEYPRFGLDAGKKFVILGIEPDLRRNIFNLTVWG